MNRTKINTKTFEQGKSFLHTLAGRIRDAGLKCPDENASKYLEFRAQSLHVHANNGIPSDSKFFSKLMETVKEYPKNIDAGQAFELAKKLDKILESDKVNVY